MRINYLVINNGIINILDQAILEFNMDKVIFRGNFINLVEVHIIKKLNSYLKHILVFLMMKHYFKYVNVGCVLMKKLKLFLL